MGKSTVETKVLEWLATGGKEALEAAYRKSCADIEQLRRESAPDRELMRQPCTI